MPHSGAHTPSVLQTSDRFNAILSAQSLESLCLVCETIGIETGFGFYNVFHHPGDWSNTFTETIIIGNWPSQILGYLDETWPTFVGTEFKKLFTTTIPEDRSAETGDIPGGSIFAQFELRRNLFFKVSHPLGGNALVSFSGNRHPVSEYELTSLSFWSSAIFEQVQNIRISDEKNSGDALSPRERECIKWTSMGKTSSEIGKILDLSENTINNYIINACRKLDAVNRSHAVYIAMKRGMIS